MKEQLYGFEPTEREDVKIREWKEKHNNEAHNGSYAYAGAIGGRYTYEFTPTSIGTIGVVKCICGAEFVFRDL